MVEEKQKVNEMIEEQYATLITLGWSEEEVRIYLDNLKTKIKVDDSHGRIETGPTKP